MTRTDDRGPAIASTAYFVPTNRECGPAISSYCQELRFARRELGRAIPMIVSETNEEAHVQSNAAVIRSTAAAHPELEILHLTLARQRRYFEELLADEPSEFSELFVGGRHDYGSAMNKLFLMTCSLGAEGLHRRDSDTTLLSEELPQDKGRFPIEVELSNLGRPASQVTAQQRGQHADENGDPRICVVGGNYYGEWNLDVKDLAARSYDLVESLFVHLGFDPASVSELCAEIFPREQTYLADDVLTLVRKVNDGPNADCGNFAMTGLHEVLPNVPGRNMLAADYFTFDIGTSLGIPSLHHTRSVFHQYTSTRFQYPSKLRYWEGVARFADYFNLYGPMFEHHAIGAAEPDSLVPPSARQALLDAVAALPEAPRAPRLERIEAIAQEVLIPMGDGYAQIGEHLGAHMEGYLNECDEDYRLHALLIERWPVLIQRAKSLDLRAFAEA